MVCEMRRRIWAPAIKRLFFHSSEKPTLAPPKGSPPHIAASKINSTKFAATTAHTAP